MGATDPEVEPDETGDDQADGGRDLDAARRCRSLSGGGHRQHDKGDQRGRGAEARGDVEAEPEPFGQRLRYALTPTDQVARARGGQRDQDRDAQAATDLAGSVDQT